MARCVIVSGAPIGDYSRIRRYLRPDDFFVFCDGGLRHRAGLQAEADLIVGDFDSHEKPAGGWTIRSEIFHCSTGWTNRGKRRCWQTTGRTSGLSAGTGC